MGDHQSVAQPVLAIGGQTRGVEEAHRQQHEADRQQQQSAGERRASSRRGATAAARASDASTSAGVDCSGGRLSGDSGDMVVFQIDANDLGEARFRGEAERLSAPSVEAARPAGDDAVARLVGLATDQPHRGVAADTRATPRSARQPSPKRRASSELRRATEPVEVERRGVEERSRPPRAARRTRAASSRGPAGSLRARTAVRG